ncbi:hypothetical protein GCM10023187_53830 [Nibrella viscosa]|uniref:Lipoprotein n=1 Tax=Nibrella viscosa TaxID=1084524 RepID=A0ABP8KYW4_9BACT
MRKNNTTIMLLFVLITLFYSCNNEKIVLPVPSSAIEGVYYAESYYSKSGEGMTYPILGKTMILKLTSVSKDSVKVELEATPNGDYSPGSNRNFERLFIKQEIEAQLIAKKMVNCIGYSIDLPINQNNTINYEKLRQICGTGYSIYYYFITPNSKVEATVRFIKM